MNTKKKYAIRKLAVGVASVSIGLFISNTPEVAQTLGSVGGGVIQAFDNGTETTSNETTKQWKPEGSVVAQGEDGVPWELYENGYLLFKPVPGKDTLSNNKGSTSWKENYGEQIKAIGFTNTVYAPVDSDYLFSKYKENYPVEKSLLTELNYVEANKINTSKVISMIKMFSGASSLTNLDVSKWDTSKVTNMSSMFSGVSSLTNLDVSKWNTSNVNYMMSMFEGASSLTNLDVSKWNTSNVMDMVQMFWNASSLTNLDVSKWNTSNVTDMRSMFWNASSLTNLDVSKWNTSNVTNMVQMFNGASSLTNLDVSKWNTSKVTNMSSMFDGTNNLRNLDISKWNTSNVTDMSYMFNGASSLTNLDVSKWKTTNVTDMLNMFKNTRNLRNLDVSKWNINNVTNIGGMFNGASSLTSLDISNWNTKKVEYIENMFEGAYKLKELKLGENFKNTTYTGNLFEYLWNHDYGYLYTNKWVKEDGKGAPFTIDEWNTAYRNNPVEMSGTWVREVGSTKYTLNFESGTTEKINSIEVEKDTRVTLPTPTVDKTGYKFLGWSWAEEDEELVTDTTNIGNPGETITLYAKWEKLNNVTTQRVPIKMTTIYQSDDKLDKGQTREEQGQVGEKEVITTYKVTPITGELTNPTTTENIITPMKPKVIKIGTKSTIRENKVDLPVIEKKTDKLVKGKEKITLGRPKIEKEITEYTVDKNTGEITESKRIEIVDKGVSAIKEIGTREPVNKVVNEEGKELTPEDLINYTEPNYDTPDGSTAEGNPIYKVQKITTTYKGDDTLDKGQQVVEKDGKTDGNKVVRVGTKPTVKVEQIPSPVRYEKDNSREKGQENITISGKDGSKTTTTTYTVNPNTGEVVENVGKPVVVDPTETVVKVASKDKVSVEKLPSPVRYEKDNSREKGQENITISGKDGSKTTTTTYTVNPNTGEVVENVGKPVVVDPTETVVKVASKDKVSVEKLPSPVRYEKDNSREKGQENITVKGKDGSKTTTTTYTVNPKTGEVVETVGKPVVVEPTETVVKVASKDKVSVEKLPSPVRYEKDNTREKGQENITVKGKDGSKTTTTTYIVNPKTGEVVENVGKPVIVEPTETVVKVAAKDKVSVEKLPSPVRYEKDSSREKGQENITVKGKDGSKTTTTTYTVNPKTGEVVENVGKPVVVDPAETVVKVATKDKVEVVNKKDGETVKVITSYEVNPKTGELKEVKREELLSKKGIPEVSEESTDFKGGINPTESIVREDLPELKVALIKDGDGNILEVIKEDEKPKDIQGYKNTGKTETDKDGRKVYIYEKVEDKQESPEDKKEETEKPKTEEKVVNKDKEDKKEVISKKEELPKTSASMLSTVGLFSIFGLRKNRRKDKK